MLVNTHAVDTEVSQCAWLEDLYWVKLHFQASGYQQFAAYGSLFVVQISSIKLLVCCVEKCCGKCGAPRAIFAARKVNI